jgi:hypothetical protein
MQNLKTLYLVPISERPHSCKQYSNHMLLCLKEDPFIQEPPTVHTMSIF